LISAERRIDTGMPAIRCARCGAEDARYHISFARVSLCGKCYIRYYERKLKSTVLKYGMLRVMKRPLVALSGGKDSTSALVGLKSVFPDLEVTALYIDLGIPGYSEESERVVRKVTDELGVELVIHRLREEGRTIPELAVGRFRRKPCAICGTVKRYIMNRVAVERGHDSVVTGHNLDDTVEVLFELYRRGLLEEAVRLRPVLPGDGVKLASRVKPLFEMTDEEDLYYVDAKGIEVVESWCPLVRGAKTVSRKVLIHEIESKIPGFRHTLLKAHVKRFLPVLEKVIGQPVLRECAVCGYPTTSEVCSYCRAMRRVVLPRSGGASGNTATGG
jgi:uncharacterized protein (TIGR00269 family)